MTEDPEMEESQQRSSATKPVGRRTFLRTAGLLGGVAILGPLGCGQRSIPWEQLKRQVGDRLIKVESPVRACLDSPASRECARTLRNLRSPYFIQTVPTGTETTGWLHAWENEFGPYAVAAESPDDIAAAVAFAHEHDIRLAVKGTGHDYLGRSNAADSLLIWTHRMSGIEIVDDFTTTTGETTAAMVVQAGARWMGCYRAATAAGLYIQGGECTSVGAAGGFVQGGGYGNFSKMFGSAAGNLLEVEVVTAEGQLVTANESQHPDLFWALRGGGGGTYGVVTKATYRLHPIPTSLGFVQGKVSSKAEDFQALIAEVLGLLTKVLNDKHWGQFMTLGQDNSISFNLSYLNLTEDDARSRWSEFSTRIETDARFTQDIDFRKPVAFSNFWDLSFWQETDPDYVTTHPRTRLPAGSFWWTVSDVEVSWYLYTYQSRYLPTRLLEGSSQGSVAAALYQMTRLNDVLVTINKGLAGADSAALARDQRTAINPAVFDAAAIVYFLAYKRHAFPGVEGQEPDRAGGNEQAATITRGMDLLRAATPDAGTYVNEADYFEPMWQQTFWGENYSRLLAVKQRYDPDNIFRVHHGVGSE